MTYEQKLQALLKAFKNQDLWRALGFSSRPRWDVLKGLSDDPEAIAYVDEMYAQLEAKRESAEAEIREEAAQEEARLKYEGQGVEIDPDDPPDLADLRGKKVWLYHGTSSVLAPQIKKEGLIPGKTETNYGWTRDVIFLTARERGRASSAEFYAHQAVGKLGGRPVIYRVLVDGSRLRPDPDDQDISSGRYQYVIRKVTPSQIKEKIRLGAMNKVVKRVATMYLQGKELDPALFKKLLLKNRALLKKLAKIQHPPRKPRQYFREMSRKLQGILKQIKGMETSLTKGRGDIIEEFLEDSPLWISHDDLKGIYEGGRWDNGSLEKLTGNAEDISSYIDGTESQELSEFDRRRYWDFLQKTLGYFLEDIQKGPRIPYVVRDVKDKKGDFQEFVSDQGHYYIEDGLPRDFSSSLLKLVDLTEQAEAIALQAQPKLKELIRLYLTSWQREDDARPASENIETLYHTSVKAKQLYAKGFDPVVPKTEGLGGSQGDKSGKPAISFTSDLYVAKEIMRTLREAIMVAKGQVRVDHILDWAKRGGVLDDVLGMFKSSHGKIEPRRPEHVMYLYRYYLAFMGSKGKRYDPLFFGDMEKLMRQFKSLNPRDVGILVCSVDMSDPNISYLASMHEYRVAPSSVVSIDKLIS